MQGMMEGVRNSKIFILVLTTNALSRPFCRLELMQAVNLKIPIQILLEVEPRFDAAFDEKKWLDGDADGPRAKPDNLRTDEDWGCYCEVVDDALSRAVTFRRRDFEVDAMVRELCRRNGIHPGPYCHNPF